MTIEPARLVQLRAKLAASISAGLNERAKAIQAEIDRICAPNPITTASPKPVRGAE